MRSVFLPFYNSMELEDYSKSDRREIIQLIAEYLLGCRKFNDIKKALSEYECHIPFQKVLKELTPVYHKLYRRTLRKYVQGYEVRIHDFDKYHLQKVDLSGYTIKRTSFPTESEVIKSMSYTVNSSAYKLNFNRKVQRMTHIGIADIKQSMYMRILAAYRVYLPSVGKILPIKAFYAILHSALSSSVIDKIREFDTNKSQLTVPFAILGEDFELGIDAAFLGAGKYYESPEDLLQAKETCFSELSHEELMDLSLLF